MLQKYPKILLWAGSILLLIACNRDSRYKVDVSGIPMDIKIERFENELFTIRKGNFENQAFKLKEKYPQIYRMYVENILGLGPVKHEKHLKKFRLYIYDPYWQEVYKKVRTRFDSLHWLEQQLEEAFRHIKYYFPEDSVPRVFTVVKGIDLRYKVTTFENVLAICLDMYLGKDFKYYPSLYPNYLIPQFRPGYILPDVLKTCYRKKFPDSEYSGSTMLSRMIYEGKKLFFMDVMAPEMSDTLKIGYSRKEMKRARKYEGVIWQKLVKDEMIYKTDHRLVNKYFAEGPFTSAGGLPAKTPPKYGEWLGWQIVKKYMEENPGKGVKVLLLEKNPQKIFNFADYKPQNKGL